MSINPRKHAFPTPVQGAVPGMTLRDYFATKALNGLLANQANKIQELDDIRSISELAYDLADAMLMARENVHDGQENS